VRILLSPCFPLTLELQQASRPFYRILCSMHPTLYSRSMTQKKIRTADNREKS